MYSGYFFAELWSLWSGYPTKPKIPDRVLTFGRQYLHMVGRLATKILKQNPSKHFTFLNVTLSL
jgi:hypothetical protein